MRFYFGRSARRHKIGQAHALAAIATAGDPIVTQEPDGPRLHWTAEDDRGIELHIIGRIAAEDAHTVIVYHVMPTSFAHVGQTRKE